MTETLARLPIRYAVLRRGESWQPDLLIDGLEVEADGHLELLEVPVVAPPQTHAPGLADRSGLALDDSCGLYISDPSSGSIVRKALECGEQLIVPGARTASGGLLCSPQGLCVGPFGWLFAADPLAGAVFVFTTPDLQIRDAWHGLGTPTAVAADGRLAVSVLDVAGQRVLRLDGSGRLDAAFSSRFSLPPGCFQPTAIAIDGAGTLYLACADSPGIHLYDRSGAASGVIANTTRAQALAVDSAHLYAADIDTGVIGIFALSDGSPRGEVAGFQGPVSALAVDDSGRVYIKTGQAAMYAVAAAAGARVGRGTLTTDLPLDAGAENSWYRVSVAADAPANTAVTLETFQDGDPSAIPNWVPAASTDELLGDGRFLWLRVSLESNDAIATPILVQVEAETPGDSYLEHLPAVYSRESTTDAFLERLLDLARSLLGDLEVTIADLPRLFDPATTPAAYLPWLASWLGFDVPPRLATDQEALRELIPRLHGLSRRRGTPAGVAELVEVESGAHPHIFESFRELRPWLLGSASALGFDTGLPRGSVDDLVVEAGVVGQSSIGETPGRGSALFSDTAHRFTVLVPAGNVPAGTPRTRFLRVLDEQKPAHTSYHVCFAEPRLRVGVQARVGIDAIVAGGPLAVELDSGAPLNAGARLAEDPAASAGAIGRRSRVGIDSRLG